MASNRNFAVRRLSSGPLIHRETLTMTLDEEEASWREAGAWWARARELADWATWNLSTSQTNDLIGLSWN
jgi:hypothetical protein